MRFVYPWILAFLLLLPLIGLIGFLMLRRGAGRRADFVSAEMQARLAPPRRQAIFQLQLAMMLAGLAMLTMAAARPQWGRSEMRMASRGRNLLIALDVSRSMLASDVHPNRLERAKVDILDLLEDLEGDRAGLLVFRGKANMLCPLTTDRAFLRQAIDGVSVDSAPRGETDLADAIDKSLVALETAYDQNNAILFITDGEDLAGRAVEAAKRAAARGIPVFAVGIGDPRGASIPEADGAGAMQYQGKAVVTRMNEQVLAEIAKVTGGVYIPLATSGTASTTLGAIYRQHLTRIAAREYEEQMERRHIERYQIFLIPGLLLLMAMASLSRGRLAGPRRGAPQKTAGTVEKTPEETAEAASPRPPPLPGNAFAPIKGKFRYSTIPCLTLGLLLATTAGAATNQPLPKAPTDASSAVAAVAVEGTNGPATPPGKAGARLGQRLYKRGNYAAAAEAYLAAARGADPAEANRYRYNAALARYMAGDMQGAATVAHPLSMLPGHDKAAELYGAANFKLAESDTVTNARMRADALERSVNGFQQALRSAPGIEPRQRNLDRALKHLPAVREEAQIEKVLEEHGQTPPPALIDQMLREQRAIMQEAPVFFTNQSASAMIAGLEGLSERERANRDLWIPLKQALIESQMITNEQERAQVAAMIEQTRDAMQRGVRRLADLEWEGMGEVAAAEQTIYNFWQLLTMPPGLVAEAITAQTNAWARPDAPRLPPRPDQPDAMQLTRLFQDRFGPWADQVQQQAQSDTNAPSLAPEDRSEIEALTSETISLHKRIMETMRAGGARPAEDQYQALKNLKRIQELLPRDKSPQSPPPQQPPQDQPKDPQQQQDQPPQDEQEDEQKQSEPPPESKDEPPPEAQEVLRRALQREREHEAEKQRQMREYPLPPSARDW